jgi:hypothetical protein
MDNLLTGKHHTDEDAVPSSAGMNAEAFQNANTESAVESGAPEQLTSQNAGQIAAETRGVAFSMPDSVNNHRISFYAPSQSGNEVPAVYWEAAATTEMPMIASSSIGDEESFWNLDNQGNASRKRSTVLPLEARSSVNKRKKLSPTFSRFFVNAADAESITHCCLLPIDMPLLANTKSNITSCMRQAGKQLDKQSVRCGSFLLTHDDLMSLLPENWLTDKVSILKYISVHY